MPAKKGEQFTSRMSNEHRVKIQNSNILNALIEHACGTREMTSTQVTAGLGLLKKALPDLSAVEHDHTSSDGSMTPKGLDASKLSQEAIAELMAVKEADEASNG